MKKVLVLIVAMLALAGLATMAHADQDVWKESWISSYPAIWMGEKQVYYSTAPTGHALTYSSLASGGAQGNVVKYEYDPSKETWSGEVVTVNGDASATATTNLSAYSQLKFKVAKPADVPDVVIQKFTMTDANNIEHSVGPITISSDTFSQEVTIDLAGLNLTAVAKLWGVIITKGDNGGGTDKVTFYVDDIRYVGGGRGEVIVKVTGGMRGISVANRIDFGSVSAGSVTNSNSLSGNKYFDITNIGDYQVENVFLNIVNPTGWTAINDISVSPRVNQYILAALFNTTASGPADGVFSESIDCLSTSPTPANDTNFAGDMTGMAIAKGGTDHRYLFLKFFAPNQTSFSAETKLYIEVTIN